MHSRTFGPALLLAACALGGHAGGADWPRFRGPNGSGVADDKTIPVTWTDKDIAWKVPLPGGGHSSPIVRGDRLFVQTASADAAERQLLCYDTADGKKVWSATVHGGKGKIINPKGSHASSTPATDGERVYAVFWDGTRVALYAFDFKSGAQLWKHDLGPYPSQHGPGHSPMIHAGKVFLLNDHDKGASAVALDPRSGRVLWEAKRRHERACYSTPFVLDRQADGAELIVGSTHAITAYEPETGAVRWEYERKFDGGALRTVACPLLANGLIVASSGGGEGPRHTVAIVPGSKANGTAASLAWEMKRNAPYVPCFLGHGDHLYWVNDQGLAGCSVTKTGEVVWSERLPGGGVTSSPVLVGGNVYVANEKGDVFVYPAEPKFRLRAKNALGEGVMATPAVAGGRMFVRGEKHLFCIGKGTQ